MEDVHGEAEVMTAGAPLDDTNAAVVLIHGRGSSARSILSLVEGFGRDDVTYLAPQAATTGRQWYPESFLAPIERNQPALSSALGAVGRVTAEVRDAGVSPESVGFVGFSQGACLSAEYVARNPRRYGGVAVLSGGLIGETVDTDAYDGSLDSTPVFLGCSDVDPHIPVERVHETARVFESLGADVTERIYEDMAHTVNDDELGHVAEMVDRL